jgi:hypothetical protein
MLHVRASSRMQLRVSQFSKALRAAHLLDAWIAPAQVLVQGALLPPANFTRREFLQEPKQGPRQPTACPVPASYTSRVNLTVLTKTSWFTSVSSSPPGLSGLLAPCLHHACSGEDGRACSSLLAALLAWVSHKECHSCKIMRRAPEASRNWPSLPCSGLGHWTSPGQQTAPMRPQAGALSAPMPQAVCASAACRMLSPQIRCRATPSMSPTSCRAPARLLPLP